MDRSRPGQQSQVLGVAELTQMIKRLLEHEIGRVQVSGELSNVRRYASGHLYFTLKDAKAQVACVMWRSRARGLRFTPRDGDAVLALGAVSVYLPRGQYQLVVDGLHAEGAGALLAALQELKARLSAEGLFDAEAKRPIPAWPRRICLVTSRDAAALRDMVRVIHQRSPWVELVLAPTRVQGRDAPPQIVAALNLANRCSGADFIVLGRGGGSLEDLWAFNDERVVRAVRASALPVVSAVGHETDWSLSDLAADLRVATPTHAGMLVPDGAALQEALRARRRRLGLALAGRIRDGRLALSERGRRIDARDPKQRLRPGRQRLADLQRRLSLQGPRVLAGRQALGELRRRLVLQGSQVVRARRQQLSTRLAALSALSPLAVLGRGYALVRPLPDGPVLRDAGAIKPGAQIRVTLHRGSLDAEVREVTVDPARPTRTDRDTSGSEPG